MVLEIVNRVLIIAFIMSSLITIRHAYYFIQAFLTSTEEVPVKYKLSKTALVILCISISYMISVIFTGFKI